MSNLRMAASFVALLLVAREALAADDPDPCALPYGVEAELAALTSAVKACGADGPCLSRADEAWRPFLERYPRSFLVHRGYQMEWPVEVQATHRLRNQKRLEATPLDPLALTLRARDLLAQQPEEALALLDKALEVDPGYAWAHFTLAYHYVKTDKERARPHVVRLAETCPDADSRRMASLLSAVGAPELGVQCASVVRQALGTLPADRAVRAYTNLWALAFHCVPPSEHEVIRGQLRVDLAKVAALKLEDSREWWSALEKGYAVTADVGAREAVRNAIAERYPCESGSIHRRLEVWDRENAPRDAPATATRSRARLGMTSDLVAQCPDSALAWYRHLRAATMSSELSDEAIGRIADAATEVYSRGGLRSVPSPYATAADIYLDRGMRLERVAALLERDCADAGAPDLGRLPEKERTSMEAQGRRAEWGRKWRALRAAAQLGTLADAAVAPLESQREAEPDTTERGTMTAQLAWLRGDRAAGRGAWADAFAFYHQASGTLQDTGLVKRRDDAWKRAGGTAAGLAVFLSRATVPFASSGRSSNWRDGERRLPAAALDVVGGGKWGPEALVGRRTFVNVWATWCRPCLDELPLIQKLHERLAGREDVALLTLNADQNPGLVEPLLRERGFTFPTVFATDYIERLGDVHSLPTNWIVDVNGVVRMESEGFTQLMAPGETERWVDEAVELLEQPPPRAGS